MKMKQESYKKNYGDKGGPGPGSYVPPSDFGYLEMYKNTPRTSQSPRPGRNSGNTSERHNSTM